MMSIHAVLLQILVLNLHGCQLVDIIPGAQVGPRTLKYCEVSHFVGSFEAVLRHPATTYEGFDGIPPRGKNTRHFSLTLHAKPEICVFATFKEPYADCQKQLPGTTPRSLATTVISGRGLLFVCTVAIQSNTCAIMLHESSTPTVRF